MLKMVTASYLNCQGTGSRKQVYPEVKTGSKHTTCSTTRLDGGRGNGMYGLCNEIYPFIKLSMVTSHSGYAYRDHML